MIGGKRRYRQDLVSETENSRIGVTVWIESRTLSSGALSQIQNTP